MVRNSMGWMGIAMLIDVLLVASLACHMTELLASAAAPCRKSGDTMMNVQVIGSLVCDYVVDAGISLVQGGMPTKTVCAIRAAYGGGAINVATAAQEYGAKVDLTLLVGNDALGDQAVVELSEQFASLRALAVLKQTRLSICFRSGEIYGTPPERVRPVWDAALERSIRAAALTIVAPLPASERPLVQQILATQRALFMPSADQLRDLPGFLSLANLAATTICNDAEARLAVGGRANDPLELINALRERGLRSRIIITSRLGAMLWEPRRGFDWCPALAGGAVVRTTGAGDRATALYATALVQGFGSHEALAAGQIEAGRHVRNLPKLGSVAELLAWGKAQPVVNLAEKRQPTSRGRILLTAGATVAASLLLSTLGLLF